MATQIWQIATRHCKATSADRLVSNKNSDKNRVKPRAVATRRGYDTLLATLDNDVKLDQ
jgi:hypothetical protein